MSAGVLCRVAVVTRDEASSGMLASDASVLPSWPGRSMGLPLLELLPAADWPFCDAEVAGELSNEQPANAQTAADDKAATRSVRADGSRSMRATRRRIREQDVYMAETLTLRCTLARHVIQALSAAIGTRCRSSGQQTSGATYVNVGSSARAICASNNNRPRLNTSRTKACEQGIEARLFGC